MNIDQRILSIRKLMEQEGIDAYIIPSSDPHQSEYVCEHWKSRQWISGFTGSAGTVVIFKDKSGLWTDSRYFIQAEAELKGSEIKLHKVIDRSYVNYIKYLSENLGSDATVGVDGRVFSFGQITSFKKILGDKGIALKTGLDFVTKSWTDRESLPKKEIFALEENLAGKSITEKFNEVRTLMDANGANHYLIAALDSIAWILNLRGSDIDFNPVFYSYGILSKEGFKLFIDGEKVNSTLRQKLSEFGISISDYSEIYNYLSNINPTESIYVDVNTCNYNLYDSISCNIVKGDDFVANLKTIKNATEIENLKYAHEVDGAALVRFYMWLENELKSRTVSEYEAGEKLAYFRAQNEGYISESFSPIVGYKSNGAIVHYSASKDDCKDIRPEGMLLVDSGGQYKFGTTDITRTTFLGEPGKEEKRDFTLVLKGHIAVDLLRYPKGTNGYQIDTFARQYLWRYGLNFYHGTGHGVGFFLNVHEGPQGISSALAGRTKIPIMPGMLNSNEPGYYKEDNYGIRIENLILTVEDKETEYGQFFKHETITLFPIDVKLVETSMLTDEEKNWLNNYHNQVYDKLSKHLNKEEKEWLKNKCERV